MRLGSGLRVATRWERRTRVNRQRYVLQARNSKTRLPLNQGAAQRNQKGARHDLRPIARGSPNHQIESGQDVGGMRCEVCFAELCCALD